jgi:hypothetical protein
MNRIVVFLGIFVTFMLLAPYLGLHPFGKPVSSNARVSRPSMQHPINIDDMDLMEPVDPTLLGQEEP